MSKASKMSQMTQNELDAHLAKSGYVHPSEPSIGNNSGTPYMSFIEGGGKKNVYVAQKTNMSPYATYGDVYPEADDVELPKEFARN